MTQSDTGAVDVSYDPRSGLAVDSVPHSDGAEVVLVVGQAMEASFGLADASPQQRQFWLDAVADALIEHRDELVEIADRETALGAGRLAGEVERTAAQIRFYALVAVEGGFLGATLDSTAPALARVNVPIGPVAVFGASNFPFAFSALGHDTASALAAGCPVVVKAHPAHPVLSRRVVKIAQEAWERAGGPPGAIGVVHGFEAGIALVRHRDIAAVGFTGSQAGGLALWRLAHQREVPIPVYAEMGTVNPVVVTPAAVTNMAEIAQGFVESFTLGNGQFCTKPGLLLAPAGANAARLVGEALEASRVQPIMLTEGIARATEAGIERLLTSGAALVARTTAREPGWNASAAVLTAEAQDLVPGSALLEEVFGAVVLVVEYDSIDDVRAVLHRLQNALAGAVLAGPEDPDAAVLLDTLATKVGRVILNGWPTGVACTWAQQHGGPWPATSNPTATSVGAGALARFVRPVAYQGLDDGFLPPALRRDNPWGIARRVDGVLRSGGEA